MAPVEGKGAWAASGLAIWPEREKRKDYRETNLPYGLGGALERLNTFPCWDIFHKRKQHI